MPSRSDITPRDMKDVLRNIVVFERLEQDPSRYMFRLIGTALTDVAGHVTGKTGPSASARWPRPPGAVSLRRPCG